MIGRATVFAIVLLAPGLAFAADSASTSAAPPVSAHDTAGTTAAPKSDVKSDAKAKPDTAVVKSDVKSDATAKPVATVKTVKAKGHKGKATPAAEKKTDTKTDTKPEVKS